MLCVGTEWNETSHREQGWRSIEQVRKVVFRENLRLCCNFTEFEIKFWDDWINWDSRYFHLQNPQSTKRMDQILGNCTSQSKRLSVNSKACFSSPRSVIAQYGSAADRAGCAHERTAKVQLSEKFSFCY